jgi:hypothetical protein
MGKNLFNYVSNEGKNLLFGLPSTEELVGKSAFLPDGTEVRFGDELAVKCDDDLFLADMAGKILLAEEIPDESLKALDTEKATAGASALPEALEGWETELSFASGYVLTAVFKDGTLTISPSPEPVIPNPYVSDDEPAPPEAPEAPGNPPVTLSLQAVETGEKRFLLRFPETGETIFLDARRFLLYGILRGRIVAGFVELPPK